MTEQYKATVAALSRRFPHLFRSDGEYSTPPVWHAVVERLCERVDAALDDQERQAVKLWKIRIKIAELRVSWIGEVRASTRKKIEKAIRDAVADAAVTCEACGKPAKRRRTRDGVVIVSCWKHRGG